MVDLAPANAYGLTLSSPVMVAAGALGYGVDLPYASAIEPLGALITATTLPGRGSARPPQLIETASGLLVSGEWAGRPIKEVLERLAPTWATWRTPVILSVSASDLQGATAIARALEGVEGVAGIELDLTATARAPQSIAALRGVTLLPLLAKLPADAPDLVGLARAVEQAGADALVVAAPPAGAWVGQGNQQIEGRLCGAAWHPLALRLVAQVAGQVGIAVIGAGGITDLAGARRMLGVGAAAIQIGSALLANPELAAQIARALADQPDGAT
jgi:dihydroorotate dehydrogenase (NAD+) catalytic subunit